MTVCHLLLYMNILFGEAKVIWTGTDKDKLLSFDITHSVIRGEERIEFILNFANGSLRHFKYSPAPGSVSDLLEIAYAVKNAHFAKDKSEECVTVFYEESTGEMFKLSLLSDTDTWEEENIIIDDILDDVVSRNVYVTRIQAANADMSPAVYTEFMLWAKSHLHVKVNGRYHDIGPNAKVQVKTDYKGEVVIYHEAFAIAEEDILLSACPGDTLTYWTDVHAPYVYADNTINLRVSDRIERKISKLSGQQLKDAKNLKGSYLLEEKFRNDTDGLNNAAKCVTDMMTTVKTAKLMESGKRSIPDITLSAPYENALASGRQGFLFTVEGNEIVCKDITAAEYDDIVGSWYANGASSFWASLGDLFRSAVKKFVQGIKTVIKVVGQAIHAAVSFVLNGISYVIEGVVSVIQQALNVVETIFVQLLTPFVKLIEWLGDPLDFEGLRLTARAVDAAMEQAMVFFGKGIKLAHRKISSGLGDVKAQFDLMIEEMDKSHNNSISGEILLKQKSAAAFDISNSNYMTDCIGEKSWVVCDINCILDLAGCCNCCQDESGTVNTVFGIAGTVLGVIYCIFSAINVAKYVEEKKALEWANESFMMLSGVMRFCMLKSIITITEGCSVAVAVVIDFIAAVMGIVKLGYTISDVTAAEIDGWDESDRAEMAELQEKLNLL